MPTASRNETTIAVLDDILSALERGGGDHDDVRTEDRERALRGAVAIWRDGVAEVRTVAIVRNVSAHGLGLILGEASPVPDVFAVVFDDTGERLICRRRWQRGKRVGAILEPTS